MNANATEPVRTAPPVYQGGRIYECNPAAVERLKALMAAERQAREAAEAARRARQNDDTLARLRAAAKRRKAQQQQPPAVELPPPAPAPRNRRADARQFTPGQLAAAMTAHTGGRLWREIAADLGAQPKTLREALRTAGYDLCAQPSWRGGSKPRFSDDEIRAIHSRQVAGERLDALAAERGVTPCSLNHRFRRLGLSSVRDLRKLARANPNNAADSHTEN